MPGYATALASAHHFFGPGPRTPVHGVRSKQWLVSTKLSLTTPRLISMGELEADGVLANLGKHGRNNLYRSHEEPFQLR